MPGTPLPTVSAVNLEYRYLWVDENWCRVHGKSEEQVLGQTVPEVWGASLFEKKYKRLYDQAFQGRPLVQRVYARAPDGTQRVVKVHMTLVRPRTGEEFVVTTVTEVADSTSSNADRRKSLDSQIDSMFQGQQVMDLLLSPEAQVLQFSQALCPYLAAGDPALEGKNLIDLLELTQSEDVVDDFYQALRKSNHGQEQVFEVTMARGQEGLADLQFCVRPRLNGGVLEFYHLTAFEVTERNASLRETRHELQSLFQVVPAPMLIGQGGTIVQANPAALCLLGAEVEDSLLGRKIADLFPLLSELGQGTRLRRQDGKELQVQMTVTPMKLGGQYHQLYLIYNLSEQIQIQEALQAATASAELASRLKTSFLNTMSHEIRTPLNGILGLLYLLQWSKDEGKKDDYLEKLRLTAREMLAIVNDVLDFSAYEGGGTGAVQVEDFELSEVLEELAQAMPTWIRTGQAVQTELLVAPGVPFRLRGDVGKLRRVLWNLCHNAVRFTPRGVVRLAVDQLGQDGSFYDLEFTVTDTGIGIEPEHLKRLFTPFQQADSSASRSYGGVGLGLYLSQRFVEILGGALTAESQPGQGSRFVFTVRFASASRADDSRAELKPPSRSVRPGGLRGRVLVVDDNDMNQEVAAEMLRQLGIRADVAGSGAQALEMAQQSPYDAILMDLQMPVMDGLETAARLRARGARMPILALTANTRLEDRAASRASGMEDFLAKPVEPDALYQCLRRFLPEGELAPAELSWEDDFPEMAGIHCREVLERLGGNRKLLRNLLLQFGQRYQSFGHELRKVIEDGDLKQTRELCHTLKGLAGNLGMSTLSTVAKQMEASARAGRLPLDLLGHLEEELSRVLPSLRGLKTEEGVAVSSRPLDTTEALPLLSAFRASLAKDLGEAFLLAEQLEVVIRGTSLDSHRAEMQEALDQFEVEKAQAKATEMIAILSASNPS